MEFEKSIIAYDTLSEAEEQLKLEKRVSKSLGEGERDKMTSKTNYGNRLRGVKTAKPGDTGGSWSKVISC